MISLNSEYPDEEILDRAAEAEKGQRPYDSRVEGVEFDDLIEYFEVEDFGVSPTIMVPNRLRRLFEHGYLKQAYEGGDNTNVAYRLTQQGWEAVDTEPPE